MLQTMTTQFIGADKLQEGSRRLLCYLTRGVAVSRFQAATDSMLSSEVLVGFVTAHDRTDCSTTRLHPRRCIAASVKNLMQRSSIHFIMRSDGDDSGPRFSAIPFIPKCDIHALADNLKDDPTVRLFYGMDHALASVDAGGKVPRRFPHRFQ